jgi:NADH oxidase (H2O2-forming)
VVAGLVTPESIVNPDSMFGDNGIELVVDRVARIDSRERKAFLSDGRGISYHKLLLATGSRPVIPPIEGHDLKGVFTLRSLGDAKRIKGFLEETGARNLVLIGAGFTSLEVGSLLHAARPGSYRIRVVEWLGHPLPLMLDPELGRELHAYLEGEGLELRMGRKVVKIVGRDGSVSGVELDDGDRLEAEMVLLNVGTRAETELARQIGLDIGECGIRVDRGLRTSDPDILAAGDCAEQVHFLTGRPVTGRLRGPAVIQGRFVAKRLAGFDFEFPGVLNNSACKIFDKNVATTGFTEQQAGAEGFETIAATVQSRSKHGMIPGVKPWTLKLVFDRRSRRVIGGQILSDDEAPAKEIDTINALILGAMTVPDLTLLMTAGNPDLSSEPSREPITIAAEQALQKLSV